MAVALSLLTFMSIAGARDYTTIGVANNRGRMVQFDVELAVTPNQQARGLMNRKSLPQGNGMLFVYDSPTRRAFWMKNTLISLDMLFFNKDGRLVFVYPNATPGSLAPIGPKRDDVCMVLEVAGGEAERLGISVGDKIILDFESRCLQ